MTFAQNFFTDLSFADDVVFVIAELADLVIPLLETFATEAVVFIVA